MSNILWAKMKTYWLCIFGLILGACSAQDPLGKFCQEATAGSFDPNFEIWCPTQEPNHFMPLKYGCLPEGEGVSLPISWKGVPEEATNLRILVEDTTCTQNCSNCCKFNHWVLNIHLKKLRETETISLGGIAEGVSGDPSVVALTLLNSKNERGYAPFCPYKNQTHAIVIKAIAYRFEGSKVVIVGRTQSVPLLYSAKRWQ